MRRFVILLFIIMALCRPPAALAQDGALPLCADAEFIQFFNMIAEHQALFDGDISSASLLNQVIGAQMERRAAYQTAPAQCAEAIAIQSLLIQLGGDALARAALDLTDTPADDNPYLQRLPGDQARIEGLLSAMLGIDRSDAPPAEERVLPACAPADWATLDSAAAALLGEAESTRAESDPAQALAAIDRLLRWREDIIPALPQCAESIDLIRAINAGATDAAAARAFAYGGVSHARNPFPPLLEASAAAVTNWRARFPRGALAPTASASAFLETRLPACSPAESSEAFDSLQAQYAALLERADAAGSSADLLDYGAAQIAFRGELLAQLPMCAEAFAWRWQAAETLADAALRSAIELGAPASLAARRAAAMTRNAESASSSREKLESQLTRDRDGASAPQAASAPACNDADQLFLLVYLVPEFGKLTDAMLKLSLREEVAAFIDQSDAFRQLLWRNLPRCADALEMGSLMRAVAADAVAMFALEMAGAPVAGNPYLPKIAGDIRRFYEWSEQFNTTCSSVSGATMTYYVVAENLANIRACASTDCAIVTTASRGQRLDVLDNLSNWYEIVLPSCETAFIAGFLASQTPPGA